VVLVKKSAECKLAYGKAYMTIFLADACRQSALRFKRKPKGHENKKHFACKIFLRLFFKFCTFQDTFEGLHDVSADSKLVDISYCNISLCYSEQFLESTG